MDIYKRLKLQPIKSLALPTLSSITKNQLSLKKWDPSYKGHKNTEEMSEEIKYFFKNISELQYKLYAENNKSLLIILQGVDASGKDGTIRHVMKALNPQSCKVKSFKTPNEEEMDHDYLWRIHYEIPTKGHITIFNRSHYEDIIEPSVHNNISEKNIISRYRQINDFERYLSENHIKILKFFLYISKNEQKKRLMERLHNPQKNWKIKESDLINHKNWNKYINAYEKLLSVSSNKWAPWYIIPANSKQFRNWAISYIIMKTLIKMKPKFPVLDIDPAKFNID